MKVKQARKRRRGRSQKKMKRRETKNRSQEKEGRTTIQKLDTKTRVPRR
jgi:hypothetical protein